MDRKQQFLELLKNCHGRWRAVARSYAAADAEDLFQEILLQIWRSLEGFRGEAAEKTWCYRVALNTAMNWSRSAKTRRARLASHNGSRPSLGPVEASANAESVEVLQGILAEQTPADRAILLLLLDDVGYGEMAEILGTTESALRVRVHRLKQRLRERYKGTFDGF